MLSNEFSEYGIKTFHAEGDADLLIVQKSLEIAELHNTALVRDDTDLLVLVVFHAKAKSRNIYLMQET